VFTYDGGVKGVNLSASLVWHWAEINNWRCFSDKF